MTVQKAKEMIQNLRNCELETLKIFTMGDKLDHNIRLIAKGKADYLDQILSELNSNSFTCNHPKKLLDIDPEGKPYCMGCNQDL